MTQQMQVRGKRRHGKYAGFTLAEILVALALIALLAAVLLPTVAGQILKGDAGRVMQDLDAVRSGADQFLADVHRYPGRYSHLSTALKSTSTDINGNTITAGLRNKWGGPYVTKDTAAGVVMTGFGGTIMDSFKIEQNSNLVNYVTVIITGISAVDFDKIDVQVDGTTSPGGRTTGLVRFVTAGGIDSTKFLATPIQ
jgi:general secretion pathway protein G